jgi:hypothetical protein
LSKVNVEAPALAMDKRKPPDGGLQGAFIGGLELKRLGRARFGCFAPFAVGAC